MSEDKKMATVPETPPLPEEEANLPGCPGWMVTFGDAISLLMTFFVLILAFTDLSESTSLRVLFVRSKGGEGDFKFIGSTGGDTFNPLSGSESVVTGGNTESDEKETVKKQVDAETLELQQENNKAINLSVNEINQFLSDEEVSADDAEVTETETPTGGGEEVLKGFQVSFNQEFVFSKGTAYMTHASREVLDNISLLLSELQNDILISGSGDDFDSIPYPLYTSSAQLGIARANALAQYFISAWNIAAERICVNIIDTDSKQKKEVTKGAEVKSMIALTILSEYDGYARRKLGEYE